MDQTAEAEALHTVDWWQSRTHAQLLEMLRAGLVVDEGAGAHRELERRAREVESAAEREADLVRQRNKAYRLRILGLLLLGSLLALVATMLMTRFA